MPPSTLPPLRFLDQRRQPRLHVPFPVHITGKTVGGDLFEGTTVLDNLSVGGLFFRLRKPLALGTEVEVTLYLWNQVSEVPLDHSIRIQGEVVRIEAEEQGEYGLAARIRCHDFMD